MGVAGAGLRTAALAGAVTAGAPLLRQAIRSPAGGPEFRRRTLGLAAWWTGCAALGGGPRAGRGGALGVGVGLGSAAVFAGGALVIRHLPTVRERVAAVTSHAVAGDLPVVATLTAATGVSEELLFRGPVFEHLARFGPDPLWSSTAAYTVITLATGNPMLVLAAIPVGVIAGMLRARTGGVLAPTVFHVTWSLTMLALLPRVLGQERDRTVLDPDHQQRPQESP